MHILLFILLTFGATSQAAVVDRIVAQVDDQLVLASEVGLEKRLAEIDKSDSPFWDPSHKTATERLVDAAIIRLAAGDIDIYQPADQAVLERRELVRQRIGDRAAWDDFLLRSGLDDQTFDNVIRRRIVVERYLGRNNQVDVANPALWLQGCEALVAQLRERSRVRLIETHGQPR